jgi:hypothetical protein
MKREDSLERTPGRHARTGSSLDRRDAQPGKRTLTEAIAPDPSQAPRSAASPAAVSSGRAQAARSGPDAGAGRPTLDALFGGRAVQHRLAEAGRAAPCEVDEIHAAAARGVATPVSAMPHGDALQRAFGRHDISSIQAHVGPEAAAAARGMSAAAYATGPHVVFDGAPDLHTAAHEAAHVVQQRAGVHLTRGVGSSGDVYERHADAVADRVVGGGSAEVLLDQLAPGGAAAPAVQHALVDNGLGYHTDDREHAGTQHFTLVGGAIWQDQNNYRYRYHVNEELEVTQDPYGGGYPADHYWDTEHQVELIRHTGNAQNGDPLRIYVRGSNVNQWQQRWYYDGTHRYRQVPTQRVRWVNSLGQFVEELNGHLGVSHRVLTPDGLRVDKQYAVTKEGRNYVVPFKDLQQNFLPGLPAVFGGNVDPGETAQGAIGREIDEESGNGVALNALGGQLLQQQDGGNRYTIHDATVTTQAPNALLQEMGGTFEFTASAFVGHTGSYAAVLQQLLVVFAQHLAAQNLVAYLNHVAGLDPLAQTTWAQSSSMQALAAKIQQDVTAYTQGRDHARNGQLPLVGAHAEHQVAYAEYQQGNADARAGQAAANQEPAYTMGYADYVLALNPEDLMFREDGDFI